MKPIYTYPELFLQKIGDLYWATGHPAKNKIPEENWKPLGKRAEKRVPVKAILENLPQLTLPSEYGQIDYVRTGKKGAPTILLVPGFPDCWFTFHQIIPLLAEDYDIVTYSPPGHGYSTFTSAFDFSIDSYALVMRMLIHRLQLKDIHLVGHSVGGEQAIRTTLQLKSREVIQSLTLINAWAPSLCPEKTSWDFSEDITTWPIVGKELIRLFGGRLGGMKEMFKKIFFKPEERPHIQNLASELTKTFTNGTAFHLFIKGQTAQAITKMQKEQKRINESVKEYFDETRKKYGYLPKIPTLVIGTKYDRLFPISYAQGLYKNIHQFNEKTYFRKIYPSGHMPQLEAPKRLAEHLKKFIFSVEHPESLFLPFPESESEQFEEPLLWT